jgi:ribonuclease P protein component
LQLHTLKKRSEFQRVRGGGRYACAAFVMEGKPRATGVHAPQSGNTTDYDHARFGFTITKKIGNAVVRNRIRRRLRAALTSIAQASADPNTDYVLIARIPSHTQPYSELVANLNSAFRQVRSGKPSQPHANTPKKPKKV